MRICLIGATHPCHNPRLIREADSLTDAGHDVRVVAPSFVAELRNRDRRLMKDRRWRLQVIDFCPGGFSATYRAYATRGARRACEEIFNITHSPWFGTRAYAPALRATVSAATSEPVDWFIAHAHRALPAAAAASKRSQAKLGFDCEDLLSVSKNEARNLVSLLEKAYLLQCDYVSVPSEAIARVLVKSHRISLPIVLYNVFPVAMLNGSSPPRERELQATVKLHWFGQVIGPGRGIEDAVEAIAMLDGSLELHLRGRWNPTYEKLVKARARTHRLKVITHPPVDHDELIRTMVDFDIGLALERGEDAAYSQTVTNKLGSYLLAGLAIAATDTPGQREILGKLPAAGFLYPPGNAALLAAGLKRWIDDRNALRDAQQTAWDVARERFCWDVEKQKFFAALIN